jgi:hypothetical protein
VTADALSKSATVGVDVAEIEYAAAKFIFTEVDGPFCVPVFFASFFPRHSDPAAFMFPPSLEKLLTRLQIGGSMAPIWQRYFDDCDCVSLLR